jgi:hypothetical protein
LHTIRRDEVEVRRLRPLGSCDTLGDRLGCTVAVDLLVAPSIRFIVFFFFLLLLSFLSFLFLRILSHRLPSTELRSVAVAVTIPL